MTDLRQILPNQPSHSPAHQLQILAGYVSTERPAPTSFADQLWVTVPGHGTDPVYAPPSFPACQGSILPQQGDPVTLGIDDNGTAQCLTWSPAIQPSRFPPFPGLWQPRP